MKDASQAAFPQSDRIQHGICWGWNEGADYSRGSARRPSSAMTEL